MSAGSADRAGDVDPPEARRGCHHFSDVATAATPRHPADTHPKHGQHLHFHDGHSAHLRGGSPESGQWRFILTATIPLNLPLCRHQFFAACEQMQTSLLCK